MNKTNLPYYKVAARVLQAAFKAAPFWMLADCLVMVLSSVSFVFVTMILQRFFDTVSAAAGKSTSLGSLAVSAALAVGVIIFRELASAVCNFLAGPVALKIKGSFTGRIHRKIEKIPALAFEQAETLDCIEKAKQGAGHGIELYHSVSTLLTFYGPYFIVMGVYLYRLRPLLTWSIFLIFVPMVVSQFVKERVFTKLADAAAPLARKLKYYEDELCGKDFFKETRLLGSYAFLRGKYDETLKLYCAKRWKAVKTVQLIEIGLRGLTILGYSGVLILLVLSLLDGYISVGAFAAVFASTRTMIHFMDDALSNYLGEMLENYGSLKNFVAFLDLPEEEGLEENPDFSQGIAVSGVSFRYPDSRKNALEDISFHMNAGEVIALVGENGAGKTTLARLILGVYPPTSGTVSAGGVPLSAYAKNRRFARASGVMQQFGRYKMSLRDNVTLSDREGCRDAARLDAALEQADFSMAEKGEKLQQGPDTMLSRDFGGAELSGGEWQRLALARGLYKSSGLIVLDEPTSAIDPMEEALLYQRFKALAAGKTALLITHRLGSAKIADRIVVLDRGRLIEIGSHKALLAQNGKYTAMFEAQAKWYAK